MVSYQRFVALVYSETPDGSIGSASENSQFMASIGEFWSNNRDELSSASDAEARQVISDHLEL